MHVTDETLRVIYRSSQQKGITVVSIAHRPSLWRHHNCVLRFDGQGGYQFSPFRLEVGDGEQAAPLTDEQPTRRNGQHCAMVLTKIVHASDASLVGTRLAL